MKEFFEHKKESFDPEDFVKDLQDIVNQEFPKMTLILVPEGDSFRLDVHEEGKRIDGFKKFSSLEDIKEAAGDIDPVIFGQSAHSSLSNDDVPHKLHSEALDVYNAN